MFNRGTPFNRSPFNRAFEFFVFIEAHLSGIGGVTVEAAAEYVTGALLNGEGTMNFHITDKLEAHLSGLGNLQTDSIRERLFRSVLEGRGRIAATPKKYTIEKIIFSGDFAAGDEIIIDIEKYTVTLNGENALHLVDGDFFNLQPGENTIVFKDSEEERQVELVIQYRDRWV